MSKQLSSIEIGSVRQRGFQSIGNMANCKKVCLGKYESSHPVSTPPCKTSSPPPCSKETSSLLITPETDSHPAMSHCGSQIQNINKTTGPARVLFPSNKQSTCDTLSRSASSDDEFELNMSCLETDIYIPKHHGVDKLDLPAARVEKLGDLLPRRKTLQEQALQWAPGRAFLQRHAGYNTYMRKRMLQYAFDIFRDYKENAYEASWRGNVASLKMSHRKVTNRISFETLFYAVALLDKFTSVSNTQFPLTKHNCAAMFKAVMLLSTKYVHATVVPLIADKEESRQVLEWEREILNTLSWDMCIPTADSILLNLAAQKANKVTRVDYLRLWSLYHTPWFAALGPFVIANVCSFFVDSPLLNIMGDYCPYTEWKMIERFFTDVVNHPVHAEHMNDTLKNSIFL